jgi:hypothetical protein
MVRRRAVRPCLLALACCFGIAGCGGGDSATAPQPRSWDLLSPAHLPFWSAAEIERTGEVTIAESMLRLRAGAPMTAVRYTAWQQSGLPTSGYEVTFEARRLDGSDFFAALTFPVGQSFLTFVNGGWGGATTGLSNIDDSSAINNVTGSAQRYETGVWYAFRLQVTEDAVKVWMDERLIINLARAGRRLDLRMGEIESCVPFGFASFDTVGEIRRVQVSLLPEP